MENIEKCFFKEQSQNIPKLDITNRLYNINYEIRGCYSCTGLRKFCKDYLTYEQAEIKFNLKENIYID